MYANLQQIANGFGKNAYTYLQQSPFPGIQTAISTTLASAVALLFVDARREKSYSLFFIAVLAYIAQVLSALPWLKHFSIARCYALLTPFSALTFLAIAINSLLHTIVGHSVAWKGRSYATHPQEPVRCFSPNELRQPKTGISLGRGSNSLRPKMRAVGQTFPRRIS